MDTCPFCRAPLALRVLTPTYAEPWCDRCRRLVTLDVAWDALCQARTREALEPAAVVAAAVAIINAHQRQQRP